MKIDSFRVFCDVALHQSFSLDVRLFCETIGGVFGKMRGKRPEHP